MNQKDYFVMSLVYRGQLIIIFLLQLLLARGICQLVAALVALDICGEEVSDGVQYLALDPICIILPVVICVLFLQFFFYVC